jgi:hypothetical protein
MWAPRRIFKCWSRSYVKLPLGFTRLIIGFIIKVVAFDWIALESSKARCVYRNQFIQFCGIIKHYRNEKYLPRRGISYKYINSEYVTVGVQQASRHRRHVTHNQFSCSQPSEYRGGPTPYYRPVIMADCAFMMIRWWWWYNEPTRHFFLSPQSKHKAMPPSIPAYFGQQSEERFFFKSNCPYKV